MTANVWASMVCRLSGQDNDCMADRGIFEEWGKLTAWPAR